MKPRRALVEANAALSMRRQCELLGVNRSSLYYEPVEPTADGRWIADLWPVDGPPLGPFPSRSQALSAEHNWLTQHWLLRSETPLA